ncbi:MAG: hypothetical protein EA397_17825 [Deltaproteobacteria bacterium]|nr:MAG: hypothetical protein EA397_17825 [Deltaproteobacteria bacterium]
MLTTILTWCLLVPTAYAQDASPWGEPSAEAPPAEAAPEAPPAEAAPEVPPAEAAPEAPATEPTAEEPPPPPASFPSSKNEKATEIHLGVLVGPTVPLAALKPGVLPRLETSVAFSVGSIKLGFYLTGSAAALRQEGESEEPGLAGGSYTWQLHQRKIMGSAGLVLRLDDIVDGLRPEFMVGPQIYALRSRVDGESDGESFGMSEEVWIAPGLLVSTGLAYTLGPGELLGRVEFTTAPLRAQITGDKHLAAINPMIGYRLGF